MKSYKHRENKGYMFSNRQMANEGIVKLKRRNMKTGIPVPSSSSEASSSRRAVKAKDVSEVSGIEETESNEESNDQDDEEVSTEQESDYKFSAPMMKTSRIITMRDHRSRSREDQSSNRALMS